MDRSPYAPLTPSSDGPNPLRPYYRPPSIGFSDPTSTSAHIPKPGNNASSSASFGSGILPDLSYDDILGDRSSGPSTLEAVRALTDQMMWKYSSVFLAQPFEVAKMVLQVRWGGELERAAAARAKAANGRSNNDWRGGSYRGAQGSDSGRIVMDDSEDEEEDDDDESSYFTSATPAGSSRREARPFTPDTAGSGGSRRDSERERGRERKSKSLSRFEDEHKLDLRRADSLMEVLAQLWQREGAWGVWKGTNVTFLHGVLLKTVETWTRGMLSALLNLPDPGVVVSAGGIGGLDILDSPSPLSSLGIAVAAAGVAGLLLAPLDAVRTRIMLTPTNRPPRSILPCLRLLPSWTCSPSLLAPTILHSTLPTLISTSTPLFLRGYLRVDPIISPASYNIWTCLSSVGELFIKLPIETVLRRAQIAFLSEGQPFAANHRTSRRRSTSPDPYAIETVVTVGPYTGVIATMWRISWEEGSSYQKTGAGARSQPYLAPRKGQGVQGLWRGWRVGFWALVGVWGTAALGSGAGGRGSEF